MNNETYENLIKNYKLPRISEIPDLELYMDQVLIYVKKYFSVFPYESESSFITPSMINNYVKSGLMPAPVGKKYTRRHIAYILSIFFLKQIFSLEEVKFFMAIEIKNSNEKIAYEHFCDNLEQELRNCVCDKPVKFAVESEVNSTLHHAALSIANKLYAQSLIKQKFKSKISQN